MAESDDLALANVQSEEDSPPLDISAEQLRTLQSTDITLEAVRRAADGQPWRQELVSFEGMGCCITFGPRLDVTRR